jgi:hypothetical protein
VYGFRSWDCRANLKYGPKGEIIYHVATIGITLRKAEDGSLQQKFNLDHCLEITALAVRGNWVATGDKGQYPNIIVWDCATCEKVVRLRGDLENGIGQVCFSRDRKLLAASATDEEHCVALYNL